MTTKDKIKEATLKLSRDLSAFVYASARSLINPPLKYAPVKFTSKVRIQTRILNSIFCVFFFLF